MKLKIKTQALLGIVEQMNRFVASNPNSPILENIYFEAKENKIILRATNMEKTLEIEKLMKIEEEGAITINAKILSDILKVTTDDEIMMIVDEKDTVSIITDTDNFSIRGINASDYVVLPSVIGGKIKMKTDDFVRGVRMVEYCVNEKGFTPILLGVYIRLEKQTDGSNALIFVGTDSFRIAEYNIPFQGEIPEQGFSVVIPKGNILDILQVCEQAKQKGAQEMVIKTNTNMIGFELYLEDGTMMTMTSLLLQGKFPDYNNENIIPRHFESAWTIKKNSCEQALKKITILAREMNYFATLISRDGLLTIQTGQSEKGKIKTEISMVQEGMNLEPNVNARHLTDFMKFCQGEEICMKLVNNTKPILLLDPKDERYRCVIRPFQ